ncbi:MAG: hypothetical protein KGI54_15695 [Pseudomonadota bacterium]|nr:hypothetical protein [Pseudomonadota bacterium]
MSEKKEPVVEEKPKITMRTPFPEKFINKLPKATKAQNNCPPNERITCKICGGWHHPKVVHLDYVGHAALTNRLLDVDPAWNWEPLALKDGLPAYDESGGLWIKLTINGITRLGYGNAEPSSYKTVGDRDKEVIGDALRNAAMRFGAALDLWFKGDTLLEEEKEEHKTITKLPNYPDKKIEENWDTWNDAVADGKKTPDELITMIATKYTLTETQKNKIRELGKIDDSFIDEMEKEEGEIQC